MKVYLNSIGCRLNQSEIERYANQFRAAGHSLATAPEGADLVVVNTCAVTAEAASDSRQKIRQAARGAPGRLVVTGCWSTLDPAQAQALPGVTDVVTNASKDGLVPDLLGMPSESFDLEPLARQPLPGIHLRTRAFIKAQDGCDQHCTYCVTRVARGPSRSRPIEDVVADVQLALRGGAKEIVLSGVQLGAWGADLPGGLRLMHLAGAILGQTDVPRLRFSSLEPWDVDERFLGLWQDARMCRHLHLPLQSGSDDTLRRMARKLRTEGYARVVELARQAIPNVAITTDIIAGFPGESDEEFEESLAFIERMAFAAGHVFTYSARAGTPAARFPAQVAHPLRKERNARVREVLQESTYRYQTAFLNATLPVLWEAADQVGPDGWHTSGLTDNYLRVRSVSPSALWNTISQVRLDAVRADGLVGTILPPA